MPAVRQSVGKRFARAVHHREASFRHKVKINDNEDFYRISLPLAVVFVLSTPFLRADEASPFDVTTYVISADLSAIDKLSATADVTFVRARRRYRGIQPTIVEGGGREAFRLHVDTAPVAIKAKHRTARGVTDDGDDSDVTFVHDQPADRRIWGRVSRSISAPTSRRERRLRFDSKQRHPQSATGGPLLNKRLAYIGENQGI